MQDSPDPLANSLLQPQFPGTLVLELDWLPLRTDKNDPLVLCIAGADSSFRLVEVNVYVDSIQLSFLFALFYFKAFALDVLSFLFLLISCSFTRMLFSLGQEEAPSVGILAPKKMCSPKLKKCNISLGLLAVLNGSPFSPTNNMSVYL